MKINSRLRRPPFLPSSFFLLPLLLLAIAGARAEDWTPLFNGTNLDGWVVMNGGKFSVTNGAIKIGGGMGWLRTERAFTNFVLEAEWRGLETNYNSGFFLRAGLEGKPMPTNGWQVNLKQTDLGAWLKDKDIELSTKPAAVPVGEWAKFTIEARGTNATLLLNGQRLWTHGFDATNGFIGIQAEGKQMDVRNVRVRELPPFEISGATPLEWSQRLADSEMARQTKMPKWDYTMGLFTLSLLKLNEQVPDARFVKFSEDKVGSLVASNGINGYNSGNFKIQTYNPKEFQLDAINSGKTLLALWLTVTNPDNPRLFYGCAKLMEQFKDQPRTFDGGFWHKQRYTNQMWLDGIYMAAPFYAAMARYMHKPQQVYDDVAKQILLIDEHTYDARSGLNYHGWDAAKVQLWANPQTGCSSNFWGRAEGWYAMALVDVLDFMPTNHPARAQIIATLQKTAAGIVKWQDAKTGLWWQVLDQGNRKGNYLEATASAMFVYALAKGVNRGYLSRDHIPAIEHGYAGIIKNFIQPDGETRWSLTQCCSVAGLGFTNATGRSRDGSFDYYISEPIVSNDLKGIGSFILAGIELQTLLSDR